MVIAVVANGVSMGLTLLHTIAMMTDSIPSVSLNFLDIVGTLPLFISTLLPAATIFVIAALPCQTIKSSQNAVSMASIILMLPCMIGVVPGLENGVGLACIPFSNTALILWTLTDKGSVHWPGWGRPSMRSWPSSAFGWPTASPNLNTFYSAQAPVASTVAVDPDQTQRRNPMTSSHPLIELKDLSKTFYARPRPRRAFGQFRLPRWQKFSAYWARMERAKPLY